MGRMGEEMREKTAASRAIVHCRKHLHDLRRIHGNPPPDVAVKSSVVIPAYSRPEASSGASSPAAW